LYKTPYFAGHKCWLVEYPLNSGNKTIMVAGGGINFTTPSLTSHYGLDSTEFYDATSNLWKQGPSLPFKRLFGTSIALKNR
jgi:hypothetical protein